MKIFYNLCLPFVFLSALATAAQIDAHFILLAKHSKHAGNEFILLERREHLWELPHVKAIAEDLTSDDGLLKSVAQASFNMVPIDPQRVAKFDVKRKTKNAIDNQVKEMVFAAMSGREVNPLLLEHELNRLNALNPDVRELRWVEFDPSMFANKSNFVETQCLSINDNIGPCALALNNFSIAVLSDMSVQTNIYRLLSDETIDDAVVSLSVGRGGAEPNVKPLHFMIATRYVEFQRFWYFVRQGDSYTFPLVPDVNASQDYPAKVQKHFNLEYKTNGHMYTEISNLHQDETGQYYMLIGHVHNAKFEAKTKPEGSLWCSSVSVALACDRPSVYASCLGEYDTVYRKDVSFDKVQLCPLLSNVSSHHRVHFPNGFHTAGIILIRTFNNRRYALLTARDVTDRGGWGFPADLVNYPNSYGDSKHDPLLVAALRNLEKDTFGTIKLDIDQVEMECTTISRNDQFGTIFRYMLFSIDGSESSVCSSGEIRTQKLTVRDSNYYECAGNFRWICLDDILKAVETWTASSPFIFNAETISDNDLGTYSSDYLLYDDDIGFLLHKDFPQSLESASEKKNSFNSAFMEYPIKVDTIAYAGALMLNSAARKIGFAKDGKTDIPFIPLSNKFERDSFKYFTREGRSLGKEVFSASFDNMTIRTYPILNNDTLVNNIGVSKNIVLFDISISTADPEKIEWIEINNIASHPSLSKEDKAIFADASCQELLKYWINYYAPQNPVNITSGNVTPLQCTDTATVDGNTTTTTTLNSTVTTLTSTATCTTTSTTTSTTTVTDSIADVITALGDSFNNSSNASNTTDTIQESNSLQPKPPKVSDSTFDSCDLEEAEIATSGHIDAHFILLAKHRQYDENHFILLERREHLWALPHVKASPEDLKTDEGVLKSVARASFNMVPIDPQRRVVKFDIKTDAGNTQAKEMVFAAMSSREVNTLLLEHELNRLNALNPNVRELRWVEFNPAAFAGKNNFVDTQCLSIEEKIGPCALALNNFSIAVLSEVLLLSYETIGDGVVSLNLAHGSVEPNVIPLHFMIASKYVKNQIYWNFVEQNGSYTFPLVPNVNSSKDYRLKVQKHFHLEYKTNANKYTEISNLHQDIKTGQYYMLIGHVHNAKFKTETKPEGSLWCSSVSVSLGCDRPSLYVTCLDEDDNLYNRYVSFDKVQLSPLLRNVSSLNRVYFPNAHHSVGTILIRTINNKLYSMLIAGDYSNRGGWGFPSDLMFLPEDYCTNHDPFLVRALRNLEEVTFGAVKLDIDQVEKECTTISKSDVYGNISRYRLYHVDIPAYSSGEILKKVHTKMTSLEPPGNVRWVCLDDILNAAKTWNPASPFLVNAETLNDDDSGTYHSNYLLFEEDMSFLLHNDFLKTVEGAIEKNNYNSAFMDLMAYPCKVDVNTYAGVLMLDSYTRKIGFAKMDETCAPYIPSRLGTRNSFKIVVDALGDKMFSVSRSMWNNYNHPILNYDTVVNSDGVSKKIILFDISFVTSSSPEKIEWIEIDKIITHANLSDEDKAIFADASCQKSLEYWIAYYNYQKPVNKDGSTTTLNGTVTTLTSTATSTTTATTSTTPTNGVRSNLFLISVVGVVAVMGARSIIKLFSRRNN